MCPPQFSITWRRWPTRSGCRMLLLLERHELTVSELCAVLQLPQSTVSRHLKALADDGWVASRREGTSRFYGLARDESRPRRPAPVAAGARAGGRDAAAPTRTSAGCRACCGGAERSREAFFSSAAGQWDRLRGELFGERFHLRRCSRCSTTGWVVGDLGCGTGQVSEALAPFVGARDRRRRLGRDAAGGARAAAGARQRGPAPRRRSRRCRSTTPSSTPRAGARAAPHRRTRRGRWPRRRACCGPAGGCSSSTCCRTTATSTGSRWATCGSGSRSEHGRAASSPPPASTACGCRRCRRTASARARRCSWRRRTRTEGLTVSHRDPVTDKER